MVYIRLNFSSIMTSQILKIISFFEFLGPGCLPSDDHSGGEDFSPGGRSPPTNMAVGAAVVAMVVEGDMEVPPHLGDHQGFEEDHIEDVAFVEIGHHFLEDTVKYCDVLCGSLPWNQNYY